MDTDFSRIERLPRYVFEEINQLKIQARHDGKDIIDFGMGNPDQATPDFIVNKLTETVNKKRNSSLFSIKRNSKVKEGHLRLV